MFSWDDFLKRDDIVGGMITVRYKNQSDDRARTYRGIILGVSKVDERVVFVTEQNQKEAVSNGTIIWEGVDSLPNSSFDMNGKRYGDYSPQFEDGDIWAIVYPKYDPRIPARQ